MFNSDAKLFLSASNNVSCAKTLINECRKVLSEVMLPDEPDYIRCKSNIDECKVDVLVNKIEETKRSLIELDQSFASEYMSLIQELLESSSIDTSNMSEEEKEQYNIKMDVYYRDYNYNLLYILEKYADSGKLTEELRDQWEVQQLIVKQYEVKDEMDVVPETSDKFIEKYIRYADLDKKIINLDKSLTSEEKKQKLDKYNDNFESNIKILELNRDVAKKTEELSNLKAGSEEYYKKSQEIYDLQINYLEKKGTLNSDEIKSLENLRNYSNLMHLYKEKAHLNDDWIPFNGNDLDEDIFKLKKDMGIATQDEIEYLDMNGWEKAVHNTGAFVCSVFEGLFSVVESIGDGIVMLAGGIGSIFGADTKWAEDFVKTDYAADMYRGIVLTTGLNECIAYGGAHTAGNIIGEVVGTIALQFINPLITFSLSLNL